MIGKNRGEGDAMMTDISSKSACFGDQFPPITLPKPREIVMASLKVAAEAVKARLAGNGRKQEKAE